MSRKSKKIYMALYLGNRGNGYPSISGIPARDLTPAETARMEIDLEATGLYEIVEAVSVETEGEK